jgi:hypothetical protein
MFYFLHYLSPKIRITAKVDQLMVLCDELEKQIDNAISKQCGQLKVIMTKL